jgi:WD40 repeat protein
MIFKKNIVWLGDQIGTVSTSNLTMTELAAVTSSNATTSHTGSVNCLIRINENQVATASDDATIKVWDLNTSALVKTFYGHTASVQSLVIVPGGYLASSSTDMFLMVWDMVSETLKTYSLGVASNCLKTHPYAGTLLVNTASSIRIFNATSLTQVGALPGGSFNWLEVIAPSGNVLAVGSASLKIYNYPSGTVNFTTTAFSGVLNRLRQLPDNVTVVVGAADGNITLFNTYNNTVGPSYSAHTLSIRMLEMTPDNLYLLTGSQDGSLAMWAWQTMALIQMQPFNANGPLVYLGSGLMLSSAFDGGKMTIFLNETNLNEYTVIPCK